MSERSATAAIVCHSPDAFVRAHLHALRENAASLLIPGAESRALAWIARERWRVDRVYTDWPEDPALSGFEIHAVKSLPDAREFPHDIPADRVITVLCTSGSTGQAKVVPKNFGSFAGEAESLTRLFAPEPDAVRVVTTVPFEHMYGYQYGFFWPRFAGLEAPEVRVVLPADLGAELARSGKPAWVVTTPTHLSAFADARLRGPNVTRLFSATGALSPKLAEEARRCFGVWPTDIYGSTETGTIASRDCRDPSGLWQCIPPRYLRARHEGGLELVCPEFGPEPISDVLELASAREFRVLGRAADMVKVAGKRTSLAALNAALLAVPGVRDGAYWLPDNADAARPSDLVRPVAFVVLQAGTSTQEVMADLRSRLDPVFLPRPLLAVEKLGRNAVGKLPLEVLRELYRSCMSQAPRERGAATARAT